MSFYIISINGVKFKEYAKQANLQEPWDDISSDCFDLAAVELVKKIGDNNFRFVYLYSDKVYALYEDNKTLHDMWEFTVLCTSFYSVYYNQAQQEFKPEPLYFRGKWQKSANKKDIVESFIDYQYACEKDSKYCLASKYFSDKDLEGKNTSELDDMLESIGDDWKSLEAKRRFGRIVYKQNAGWESGPAPIFKEKDLLEKVVSYMWDRPTTD